MTETTKMVIKIVSGVAVVVIGTYKIITSRKNSTEESITEEGAE